jgi:hypothetical protein
MELYITADADWDAKIRNVIDIFFKMDITHYFLEKDYGIDIYKIAFFLICREPSLEFKQRIKFDKKEKVLGIDIMLDLDLFRNISLKEKFNIVKKELLINTPIGINKFKFKNFNSELFMKDFSYWLDYENPDIADL